MAPLAAFDQIDREKRKRILQAALDVFSEEGFARASTNEIIKRAGISKGALFNYFENKEDLFQECFRLGFAQYIEHMKQIVDELKPDLFDRIEQCMHHEMKFFTEHPIAFKLYHDALRDSDSQAVMRPEEEKMMKEGQAMLFSNLDSSRLKFPLEDVMQLIDFTSKGIQQYLTDNFQSGEDVKQHTDKIKKRVGTMLEMLKYGVYKEEEL